MRRVEVYRMLSAAAEAVYPPREAEQIARILMSEMSDVSLTKLIVEPDAECHFDNLDRVIAELQSGRPMQYIIGECDFCDLRFKVREGVLIPRPETEELVRLIVDESIAEPRILDVGCGSGAISISLSKLIEGSEVWGVDLSSEALSVARENRILLSSGGHFVEGDALDGVENYVDGEFDVVVSNPPYIPQSEEALMRTNVTDFEPSMALFVEDDDPLIFYRKIARSGGYLLRSGGRLYFEIHESFAHEMVSLLEELGYYDIRVVDDINDKPRMVCATKE